MRDQFLTDSLTILKDAGAVTASGNGQVNSTDLIYDMGVGNVRGFVVFDVTAMDNTTGDETYDLVVQMSNSATFASGVVTRAQQPLGNSRDGADDMEAIGRYRQWIDNKFNDAVTYRYLRVRHVLGGTTPSINYEAKFII